MPCTQQKVFLCVVYTRPYTVVLLFCCTYKPGAAGKASQALVVCGVALIMVIDDGFAITPLPG